MCAIEKSERGLAPAAKSGNTREAASGVPRLTGVSIMGCPEMMEMRGMRSASWELAPCEG